MRVRAMQMNDAHIYVTPDQLKEELKAVMERLLGETRQALQAMRPYLDPR